MQFETFAGEVGKCIVDGKAKGIPFVGIVIEEPGQHCLDQDIRQKTLIDPINGAKIGSPDWWGILAFVDVINVDLDLKGHLITGDPFDNVLGTRTLSPASRIRIKNGEIRLAGVRSVGVSLGSMDTYNLRHNLFDAGPAASPRHQGTAAPFKYSTPDYFTVDNLKVRSGSVGVVLVGGESALRNSTIETDGPVAAYLYGPKPVIENNTFIIHSTKADDVKLPAALKLMDADGAVVRNNRFVVKGLFTGKAEAVINLIRSKNVVIEGNVVTDARQLVRKDADSSFSERNNRLD